VQVGSYPDASQANERVSALRASGFEARAAAVEIPKRGTWYRVQAGRFQTREEATRFGAQLRAKGAAENVIVAEVEKR
jgi:cell division protein FtsN